MSAGVCSATAEIKSVRYERTIKHRQSLARSSLAVILRQKLYMPCSRFTLITASFDLFPSML